MVLSVTNGGKSRWSASQNELRAIKLGLAKFLQLLTVIPDKLYANDRFLIFVISSADANHELVSAGEDALKRMPKPDLEDEAVIKGLFTLYLGTLTLGQQVLPVDRRAPGSLTLKLRAISYLSKSIRAANELNPMLQTAFDALYGNGTTTKLRSAGMSFVQWVARMGRSDRIKPVANVLLAGLLKFIDENNEDRSQEGESIRGFAYEAVGMISKKAPEVVAKDLQILRQFFKAISDESRNVKVSVQDSLSAMVDAFKDSVNNAETREQIEEVILENIHKSEPQARLVAVKYARLLFPFSHALSRYICIVASADPKIEVKEEGRRGLEFPVPPVIAKFQDLSTEEEDTFAKYKQKLPDLAETLKCFRDMGKKPRTAARVAGVRYVGSYTAEGYTSALEFSRRLFVLTAYPSSRLSDISPSITSDNEDGSKISDMLTRKAYKHFLQKLWGESKTASDDSVIGLYVSLVEGALRDEDADALLQSVASSCLLELISLGPSAFSNEYRDRIDWLKVTEKGETRMCMARILGIVATCDAEDPTRLNHITTLISDLNTTIADQSKQTTLELRHGSTLALGYIIGRLYYRFPEKVVNAELHQKSILSMFELLASTSSILVLGACVALTEIGRYGSLLPAAKDGEDQMEVDDLTKSEKPQSETGSVSVEKIVKKLEEFSNQTKDLKLQESAITALGHIGVGAPSLRKRIIDFMFTLPQSLGKHIEVNFTVGEAVCAAAFGFNSSILDEYLDIADVVFPSPGSKIFEPQLELINEVIVRSLKEVNPTSAAVSRKGVCIWLLSFVKFCGTNESIVKNLPEIHQAFSSLLADRDEFTQEVASKGIGLVYELGDGRIKSSLVESLVSTISEGRRLAPQSVTGETQIFQEGALGATPDGGSLTTYQSILSLASDMNQPDLVYKFMSLASHNAIWNSRRGASMGFSSIAAYAEKELAPHLGFLVPKLFRFQFDPNLKVAESMKSIWRSLVKEPKKTIDEHFERILADVLSGLSDRLWRTREASCLALADLIHGRELTQVESRLEEIWSLCFQRLDDIKESVRVAAFTTCKTLTSMTVKYCDPSVVSVSDGQKITNIVVPLFLKKGLTSSAEDVRRFSLSTILKICKKGGVLLKPHISDIVTTLLEGLSSMEPQVMNYLTFHIDKYNITQEQLDSSRLSAAKSSPMMEAIETCVENIDDKVMEVLIPNITNIARKGVGLPTKAGCARFIVTLSTKVPSELRPHADSLLKALSGAIADRSAAVRKSFATAIGYTLKLCGQTSVSRLITHLRSMYTDGEDDDTKSIPGITFLEMSKHSSDALANYFPEVLPLAFIGRKDANESICSLWSQVWDDNTAGLTSAVKLYTPELITLCTSLLSTNPSWTIKKQVGSSIGEIAKAIGSSIDDSMGALLPLLKESMSGRTWEGKEAVLEGLLEVSIAGKEFLAKPENKKHLDEITLIMIREAKKNSLQYKKFSIEYLGKFIECHKIDKFEELEEYLFDVAEKDEMEEDTDVDEAKMKPLVLVIRANTFRAIGKVFPAEKSTQEKRLKQVLASLAKSLDGSIWNVKIAILDAFESILEKVDVPLIDEEALRSTLKALFGSLGDMKYSSVREASAKVLKGWIRKVKDSKPFAAIKTEVLSSLDDAIAKEPMTTISEPLQEFRKDVSGMDLS
ncbi:hypothetical protein HDU67_008289 [Dinochytrium kinnereticum]|nr:hypothetical protein HDU67_008289 [Dinochytrium kinnereticum]